MKNKAVLFLFLISILFQNQGFAQDFWEQLYFPDSSSVFSITVDNQQKIIIGSVSGVYRSIDNDNNWVFLGLKHYIIHSVAVF